MHDPHCDGFEAINKNSVTIASHNKNNAALDCAKLFLGWTKEITLFFQSSINNKNNNDQSMYRLTDNQRNEAESLGIKAIDNDNSGNEGRFKDK